MRSRGVGGYCRACMHASSLVLPVDPDGPWEARELRSVEKIHLASKLKCDLLFNWDTKVRKDVMWWFLVSSWIPVTNKIRKWWVKLMKETKKSATADKSVFRWPRRSSYGIREAMFEKSLKDADKSYIISSSKRHGSDGKGTVFPPTCTLYGATESTSTR